MRIISPFFPLLFGVVILHMGYGTTHSQTAATEWSRTQHLLRTHVPKHGRSDPGLEACRIEKLPTNPAAYGAGINPTGSPIGGGEGYGDIHTKGGVEVANRDQLLDALEQARPGDVVYVRDNAEIDLSNLLRITIPEGVTLAGNRGKDGTDGSLLFTTKMPDNNYPVFIDMTAGNNRISGLRIRGPSPSYSEYVSKAQRDERYQKSNRGVQLGNCSEIDNCEVSHFYRDGIIAAMGKAHIHHNLIHDVMAYPIMVGANRGGFALIEANIIYWSWAGVASNGFPGSCYEARYNICRPHLNVPEFFGELGTPFDMHNDYYTWNWQEEPKLKRRVAGDFIHVHHNTIDLSHGGVGLSIKGSPRKLSLVHHNWFQGTMDASRGLGDKLANANVWAYDNAYGPEKALLAEVSCYTKPKILFRNPDPPVREAKKFSGDFALDVNVEVYEKLKLAGVRILLDDKEIYLSPQAPEQGDVVIDTTQLANGLYVLTVMAIDNRDVIGWMDVCIEIDNVGSNNER